MNAAYEAGFAGAMVYRLKLVRGALRRHNPDLDLSEFTPEGLFPNMSLADIDALDEAAFLAHINEWKRANNILEVSKARPSKARPPKKKAPRLRGNHPARHDPLSRARVASHRRRRPEAPVRRSPSCRPGPGPCRRAATHA